MICSISMIHSIKIYAHHIKQKIIQIYHYRLELIIFIIIKIQNAKRIATFLPIFQNSLYINCSCNIEKKEEKEVKIFSGKTLYESFYDVLKYANFKILKCNKLVFNINIFRNNIGNFIIISAFSLNFISLIFYIVKGITPLKNKIKNLISYSNEEIYSKNNIFSGNVLIQNKKIHKKFNKKIIPSNPKKKKIIKDKIFKKLKKGKIKFNNFSTSSKNSKNKLIKENLNKNDALNSGKRIEKFDKFELNQLEYEEAIYYDKRIFIKIYWDILSREHIIIFTFFNCNDYNITYIKFARFILLFVSDMTMNVFFFSDESMHKIFLNYGKFNFVQQIPQIIYTTIIAQLLEVFLCYLSLTDKHIYQMKKMSKTIDVKDIIKILKCIKIKLIIFFIFSFICYIFYWFTITSFCAVYGNTQTTFIKDSLLSFLLSILNPLVIYLIPAALRTILLKNENRNLKCIYKLSDIIPFF